MELVVPVPVLVLPVTDFPAVAQVAVGEVFGSLIK